MERLLLIGSRGQLGTDLRRTLPAATLVPFARDELDVTDLDAVQRVLSAHRPAWVINTAAHHRVDDIQTKEADELQAYVVNTVAAGHLARACADRGARLLHLSTDYVFGGDAPARRPYAEEVPAAPLSVYGHSKLQGERIITQVSADHVIVRSSGLYGAAGAAGKGGNFVETMLRLAREGKDIRVVNDQILGPTYTADLAAAIAELVVARPPGGIYHLTNAGECSWYEFAVRIFALCGLTPALRPTTSAEYAAPAPRPAYSVLANARAAALGLSPLRPWPDALAAYLRAKGHVAA